MPRHFISLCTITFLLLSVSLANATTLSDTLNKHFKKISYPNDEVVATITLQTEIPDISGDRIKDSVLLAYQTQAKLVSIFRQNGWQKTDMLSWFSVNWRISLEHNALILRDFWLEDWERRRDR